MTISFTTKAALFTLIHTLWAPLVTASTVDVFVSTDGVPTITRFDAMTGAFLGDFIRGYTDNATADLSRIRTMEIGPTGDIFAGVTYREVTTRDILRFDGVTGNRLGIFTALGDYTDPFAMAFDSRGDLYVGVGTLATGNPISPYVNGGVLKVDGSTGAMLGVFGDTSQLVSGLTSPEGMTFGPDGDLYVASRGSGSVLRYDGTSGAFRGVFGDAALADSGLQEPTDVEFGPDGNLYVADGSGDSILMYDGISGSFIGEFVLAGAGGLDFPLDIEFGTDGDLFVVSPNIIGILRYSGETGAYLGVFGEDPGHPLNSRPIDIEFRVGSIPEPTTLVLFALGLAGLGAVRRKKPGA